MCFFIRRFLFDTINNRIKLIVVLLVFTIFLYLLSKPNRAPFGEIEFIEEHPGAGDRYVVFTPVLRDNHSIVVGDAVGADYGLVDYRDCDGDGVNEAVIETATNYFGEYSASVRHVYKYQTDSVGRPRVKIIKSEYMPEKDPDWVRGWAEFKGERYCEK